MSEVAVFFFFRGIPPCGNYPEVLTKHTDTLTTQLGHPATAFVAGWALALGRSHDFVLFVGPRWVVWGLADDFVSDCERTGFLEFPVLLDVAWYYLMLMLLDWCYLMLLDVTWFSCSFSLGHHLKQFGLEGCLLLQSRLKVYIFVVMSNRSQFSSQNCICQDECIRLLPRPAVWQGLPATCFCRLCHLLHILPGSRWPARNSPMICGSSWFQSRLFFCLERFERVFRLPALNGRSRPKPTIKTKARDCAQKVELVGYRRTNEPAPAFASQIVVRAICAELYRSFDKFLEQTALGFSSDILTTDIADHGAFASCSK